MLSSIIGKKLTDIYTVGFMYLWEEPREYSPDLRWLYFEFGDTLIEFESIEQYSRIKIEEVADVRYLFETDEDMIKLKSSVKEIVLVSSIRSNNVVKSIELKDGTEENCDAVKIMLENGQVIFLDPAFPYGIGMGGTQQEEF